MMFQLTLCPPPSSLPRSPPPRCMLWTCWVRVRAGRPTLSAMSVDRCGLVQTRGQNSCTTLYRCGLKLYRSNCTSVAQFEQGVGV